MKVLLDGIGLGEQPRWHEERLWFSDWVTRELIAVDLEGNREVILEGPSFPMCAGWLPDGRMLLISRGPGTAALGGRRDAGHPRRSRCGI